MNRGSSPPPPPLTLEQRALFDSEPDVAEEAANAAFKKLGSTRFRHLSRDEMLSIATIGAMDAARTFDPASRAKYRTWAFFRAVHDVLNAGIGERRRHAKTNALLRAHVMAYLGRATAEVEIGVDTTESLTDKLHGFSDPVLGLALREVAAFKPTGGGEDEVAEVEAAAVAGDALRDVLPPAGSDDRRMLEMHFTENRPLTEVAAAMGVDARGYRMFVRRFHGVLASLREGLARRGIRQIPAWREGVSGRALGGEE